MTMPLATATIFEQDTDMQAAQSDDAMKQTWAWPSTPFAVALHEPEIPPNTGNIARLCAATGTPLHLIEPLGFAITDKTLKRAGLDYWEHVNLQRHASYAAMLKALPARRILGFSTKATRNHVEVEYQPGDVLLFGRESRGLPDDIRSSLGDNLFRIPMQNPAVRSLNLSTAVAIALYAAIASLRDGTAAQ